MQKFYLSKGLYKYVDFICTKYKLIKINREIFKMRNLSSEFPIGVFDSGVGGFTVAKELLDLLPEEEIIYFGDTKRAPYGEKTLEDLEKFSVQIIDFLLKKKCKAIVVACNTVSSTCLDFLKRRYEGLIMADVVSVSVEEIAAKTKKSTGIFATKATIRSGQHEKLLHETNPEINVFGKECPLFVPIVEEGFSHTEIPLIAAKKYFEAFEGRDIDTLVLGCTHYPIIRDSIEKAAGTGIELIDPAGGTAKKIKALLEARGLLRVGHKPIHKFYYSGESDKFENIMEMVFGEKFQTEILEL